MRRRWLFVSVLLCAWACGSSPTSPNGSPTGGPTNPGGPGGQSGQGVDIVASPLGTVDVAPGRGRAKWTEVHATRSLCGEITRQVGDSYPLWLKHAENGPSIILYLSHDVPIDDRGPLDDAPEMFTGTQEGDSITASFTGYPGGLGCPTDRQSMPQVGGELRATVAAGVISGEYTEVYKLGDAQVTIVFQFRAGM
jgi:hypothetical protein